MKKQTTWHTGFFMTLVGIALFLTVQPRVFAQDDSTKRLYLAVNGFEFNEPAAKDALAAGADVNWQNEAMGGETMLIMAIKGFKESKIIKFLLENGADPNIKDDSGKTALEWARQYNIGRDRNGREILALLENANKPVKTDDPDTMTEKKQTLPTKTAPGKTVTTSKTARKSKGAPTVDEVRETMEKSFTNIYESHFFGVKNKVTFEWSDAIVIGALQTIKAAPAPCYPVKLKVSVTAEDPRDGKTSTVVRGLDSTAGSYKEEIFCFYRDGFNEWNYGTYGK